MFAAAPVIASICPMINSVVAGGGLDGVLPAGAAQKLSSGMASVAAGAQSRVHGLLDSLRGKGIESDIGGGLFAQGLQLPTMSLGVGLEQKLNEVAGFARRGLQGAI